MQRMVGMSIDCSDDVTSKQRKLFVADLSLFTTEQDLFDLFSFFGAVEYINVARGELTCSLQHGFILFVDHNSANSALLKLQGHKFKGRKLRLSWSTGGSGSPLERSIDRKCWQIHVSFDMALDPNFRINEEILDGLFLQFGEVIDVSVKRSFVRQRRNSTYVLEQSGYAFVYFNDRRTAVCAASALRNIVLDDVRFVCEMGHRSANNSTDSHDDQAPMDPPQLLLGPREVFRRLRLSELVNTGVLPSSAVGPAGPPQQFIAPSQGYPQQPMMLYPPFQQLPVVTNHALPHSPQAQTMYPGQFHAPTMHHAFQQPQEYYHPQQPHQPQFMGFAQPAAPYGLYPQPQSLPQQPMIPLMAMQQQPQLPLQPMMPMMMVVPAPMSYAPPMPQQLLPSTQPHQTHMQHQQQQYSQQQMHQPQQDRAPVRGTLASVPLNSSNNGQQQVYQQKRRK